MSFLDASFPDRIARGAQGGPGFLTTVRFRIGRRPACLANDCRRTDGITCADGECDIANGIYIERVPDA